MRCGQGAGKRTDPLKSWVWPALESLDIGPFGLARAPRCSALAPSLRDDACRVPAARKYGPICVLNTASLPSSKFRRRCDSVEIHDGVAAGVGYRDAMPAGVADLSWCGTASTMCTNRARWGVLGLI